MNLQKDSDANEHDSDGEEERGAGERLDGRLVDGVVQRVGNDRHDGLEAAKHRRQLT